MLFIRDGYRGEGRGAGGVHPSLRRSLDAPVTPKAIFMQQMSMRYVRLHVDTHGIREARRGFENRIIANAKNGQKIYSKYTRSQQVMTIIGLLDGRKREIIEDDRQAAKVLHQSSRFVFVGEDVEGIPKFNYMMSSNSIRHVTVTE